MEFVFEGKRFSGAPFGDCPEFPAVRITVHKDPGTRGTRLYFSFNATALDEARWIRGDQIVCGADVKAGLLCFKRDKASGYRLGGSRSSGRTRSLSFQGSYMSDSSVFKLSQMKLGQWIRLNITGILMITDKIQ